MITYLQRPYVSEHIIMPTIRCGNFKFREITHGTHSQKEQAFELNVREITHSTHSQKEQAFELNFKNDKWSPSGRSNFG